MRASPDEVVGGGEGGGCEEGWGEFFGVGGEREGRGGGVFEVDENVVEGWCGDASDSHA